MTVGASNISLDIMFEYACMHAWSLLRNDSIAALIGPEGKSTYT